MGLLTSTLVILIAVAISDVLARFIPKISSSYFNILLGVGIALIPAINKLVLDFNNTVFMMLIVAPLLFFEGQRTPIQFIGNKAKTIIGTAIFLAIGSAIVATIVLHLTVQISFALALIIAAIGTPTDATALESVTTGRKLPVSVENPLKLESLFNDATGLILLQAGLIWSQTGHLNLFTNVGRFCYAAGGGIVIGVTLSFLLILLRQLLIRSTANVISSQTLLFLLSPILIYAIAEAFDVSGIIAVVSAGLVHNSETARSRFSSPVQMHLGVQLVNFSTAVLNSFVFTVLGINLGRILTVQKYQLVNRLDWLWVGVLVYLSLLACRFLYSRFGVGDHSFRSAIIFAFGGVHGTVTLALAFTVLGQGISRQLFDWILLVETVVILLSLLVPTLVYLLILPQDWDTVQSANAVIHLREGAVSAGIERVNQMNLNDSVRASVKFDLKDQMRRTTIRHFFRQWLNITFHREALSSIQSLAQRRALMYAFDAERDYLYQQAKNQQYLSKDVYSVMNEVLLAETLVLDPKSQFI